MWRTQHQDSHSFGREVILQEHVKQAHEIALKKGEDYDETMRVECARLTTERPIYWGILWPGGVALGQLLLEQVPCCFL